MSKKYAVAAPLIPEPMMATSAVDGRVGVVRCPMKNELRVPWSQKDSMGLGWGNTGADMVCLPKLRVAAVEFIPLETRPAIRKKRAYE